MGESRVKSMNNKNDKKSPVLSGDEGTYFISDLHLSTAHPSLFQLFYDFIDDIKGKAESLYILGDLFEFWLGDDIIDLPIGKPYLPVLEKLKSLSDSGTKLYFMQGNRDFLAQQRFVKTIGAELLPDEKIIDLYGTPTLIMHGDTLCTDDKAYQRMRFLFRLRLIQKLFLLLSPERRDRIAGGTRKVTQQETEKKSEMILDVNQEEVTKVAKRGDVCFMVHGHTHRPDEHDFMVDGKKAKRIVLGDWRDKACYLRVDKDGYELIY